MALENQEDDDYERISGSGISAFGEAGVEFMRLTSSRLILAARVETPFYSLERESYSYPSNQGQKESVWVMPLTISATYAW